MEEALRMAREAAEREHAARIVGIRLCVGRLSGVVPEALEFAFETVTSGTIAEGAELVIEPVEPLFWCPACRIEFPGEDFFTDCPRCGSPFGEIRRGREMFLASVELE